MVSEQSFPFRDLRASLRLVARASCPNAYPDLEILTLESSTDGLLCGLYAVILSLRAQYPRLPYPTRDELLAIFKQQSAEFGLDFDMQNTNNLSVDQVAAALYAWGRGEGLNLRLGYLEYHNGPLLISHPNEDEDVLVVWIFNDGQWENGGIGHFSGIRSFYADMYEVQKMREIWEKERIGGNGPVEGVCETDAWVNMEGDWTKETLVNGQACEPEVIDIEAQACDRGVVNIEDQHCERGVVAMKDQAGEQGYVDIENQACEQGYINIEDQTCERSVVATEDQACEQGTIDTEEQTCGQGYININDQARERGIIDKEDQAGERGVIATGDQGAVDTEDQTSEQEIKMAEWEAYCELVDKAMEDDEGVFDMEE